LSGWKNAEQKKTPLRVFWRYFRCGRKRPSELSAQTHPIRAVAQILDQDQQRHGRHEGVSWSEGRRSLRNVETAVKIARDGSKSAAVSSTGEIAMQEHQKLAVLIDADNAQPSVFAALLAEIAKYGTASVKRIYGDFTSTTMTQWKRELLRHSITPVQQFAYTTGKNATDSALIIDAMDLLYTARLDGFCLVSSDSDFTRLAQRLREQGKTVYGFGERKTPDPFIQACDKFVYTDLLVDQTKSSRDETPKPSTTARKAKARPPAATEKPTETKAPIGVPTPSAPPKLKIPMDLIRSAIEESSDEHGWANLGAVGSYLTKVRPDFDPRLYGKKKLSELLRSLKGQFGLEERGPAGSPKAIYIRNLEPDRS
jgi:hypothetical protein